MKILIACLWLLGFAGLFVSLVVSMACPAAPWGYAGTFIFAAVLMVLAEPRPLRRQ